MSGTKKPPPSSGIFPHSTPTRQQSTLVQRCTVAAKVGPDKASEPVHAVSEPSPAICYRLADWFEQCGVRSVAMEIPQGSTGFRCSKYSTSVASKSYWSTPAMPKTRAGPQDRYQRRPMAAAVARIVELLRASFRLKGEVAIMRAYLRQRERLLDYAASHIQHMQKALQQMNLQPPSRGDRRHWCDRHGHHSRDCGRGARSGGAGRPPRPARCMRASVETIGQALVGNDREEHIFALTQALELYDRSLSQSSYM